MTRPSSKSGIIQQIINRDITEEELFRKITDNRGRRILDFPELTNLKQHPSLLKQFLLTLSLEGRFRILLAREMLGMPQNSFVIKFGLNKNIIRALQGHYKLAGATNKGTIRDIIKEDQPKLEILATLFLFTRIPITWMQQEKPIITPFWYLYPFEILLDAYMTIDQLHQFLKTTEDHAINEVTVHTRPNFPYVYDVRGVILNIDSELVYLKTLFYEGGGIIVELFNDNQLNTIIKLKDLLFSYGPINLGYCETVVEGQFTMMIVAKSRANKMPIPKEFRPF
ncbi:hypothetical protein J416_14817 [Gracilibacillus halophilus YIM-C55.5]|uniref:Uncharacterized protein n=1 Tax=Gracilibacillus halophilus YIM-C55.5 TaxID=1308866 RepID=N4WHM9_9BACI|nr:hypothetical protein [Gracilibacillus halophilus]ENH95687.1 hypothetical protein J416_14817 [Gracilibacillus halophilus YIM-C55.5]